MAVESVSIDVRIKFGDSRSNGSRNIRGADCVSNRRMNKHDPGEAYDIRQKHLAGVSLKTKLHPKKLTSCSWLIERNDEANMQCKAYEDGDTKIG